MKSITHPHALAAIWLAHKLDGAPSDVITRVLNQSGVPRRLFVIAATLKKEEA